MLVKTVILFLGGMVLIGMVGKLLFPGTFNRVLRRGKTLPKPPVCRRCGRYVIGQGDCDCGKKG